jgi:hypothetical protein
MAFLATLIVGLVLTFAPGVRQPSPLETVRKLTFATPLPEFIRKADDPRRDARLVWDTDGCSAPVVGNAGKTYDFTAACRRHDFGYRNLKRIDGGKHWNETVRERVDRVFLADMRRDCAARPAVQRAACRSWANLYFAAVRNFSG